MSTGDTSIREQTAPTITPYDRPNSYIGRSVARPNARRLLAGRGTYVDDIVLPRMLHAAFVRSPYAHAEILAIDTAAAQALPGVVKIVTGAELAQFCKPWVGVLSHLQGMRSPPQYPLALNKSCWQGEPVVIIAAQSRALAEDAAALIEIEWRELPAVTDMETALDEATPVIHPELGNNRVWQRTLDVGEVDTVFDAADVIVEETFHFGRHTGVTPEPRSLVAAYDAVEQALTLHNCCQSPHMIQSVFAGSLGLAEADVRVICNDVGGGYGIKVHAYGDEVAVAALSMLVKRPVKYIADRLESFVSDIHARDHRITARMALRKDGTIQALELDDLTGIGPYSVYPRSSGIELNQILNLTGGPYPLEHYRAHGNVVFQNKTPMCQYRAVGHPIATTVAEGLVDQAARALNIDPVELRRLNLIPDDAYPRKMPSGLPLEKLSHHACLEQLVTMMNYAGLRAEQTGLRKQGIYRGIGIASFMEVTNPSPMFYGVGGARISATDACSIELEPSGVIRCSIGVTEQGQGTETMIAQIAATAVGVDISQVRVITGDTAATPYGGGAWASRGTGIGGEATWQAGKTLRENILKVAAVLLQSEPGRLDIRSGHIIDDAGTERMALRELATLAQFRTTELPDDVQPEFSVTRPYRVTGFPFVLSNGVQASYLEVDTDTGMIRLLKHWVVEDCGTIINPQLVDEQIRGGVAQGLGGVLYEHCQYSPDGQLLNGNMADYLVPMAVEMPDIDIGHVQTPTQTSEIGAKGAGEAGTGGAPAAVLNAVNDALVPFSASVSAQPITPQVVLQALGRL